MYMSWMKGHTQTGEVWAVRWPGSQYMERVRKEKIFTILFIGKLLEITLEESRANSTLSTVE